MPFHQLAHITLIVVGYNVIESDTAYLDRAIEWFGGGVFVDNGSERPPLGNPAWHIVHPGNNIGFAAAVNCAARLAQTECILLLNPDVRITYDGVSTLSCAISKEKRLAGVAPTLSSNDKAAELPAGGAAKSFVNAAIFAFAPAWAFPSRQIWRATFTTTAGLVPVGWLCGACLLLRRDPFLAAGGFCTEYFMYDEDVELGASLLKAGFSLAVVPEVRADHRGSASQSDEEHFRRWALSNQRHVLRMARSRTSAILTLVLIAAGLARRATWRTFLGRSDARGYMTYAIRYLIRYGANVPDAGPDAPDG